MVDWSSKLGPGRNIVIMTSRLLSDAHRYILRCLSLHHGVRHCTIFTSISEVLIPYSIFWVAGYVIFLELCMVIPSNRIFILLQIAHSAYPDSPLGPDAFHEYETLLAQDFEELVKRKRAKATQLRDENFPETKPAEEEGWLQFTSNDEDSPDLGVTSSGKNLVEDKLTSPLDDVGKTLIVSVHHFPMILCPLSPRAFVLPSEGSVAEAYLSLQHDDSLSQGLPPVNSAMPSDGDDASAGVMLTAHFLYHLAAKVNHE